LQNVIPGDIAKILRDHDARQCDSLLRSQSIGHVFFLLDIDFFKQVNDIYGHAAGDNLLKEFSELLSNECRESDYLVRWGGEEFLVVSRLMNQEEAPLLAERLLNAICNHPFRLNDGTIFRKTCSIGFASYPFICQKPTLLSWEQVIDVADQALYLAKNAGRNRFIGLAATETTESEHLYTRIRDNTQALIESDELSVISSDKP
jgi:diguanylate cyclase (GGDEF)-like protein